MDGGRDDHACLGRLVDCRGWSGGDRHNGNAVSVGVGFANVDVVVIGVDSITIDTMAVGERNAFKALTGL